MQSVQDAIYNWLTIYVVCDSRPDDLAAVETERMFYSILVEDYEISNIEVDKDDRNYHVSFLRNNEQRKMSFPKDLIDVMLKQINEAPDKYIIYPE